MKAMILAAGRGERLRPLTDRVPKPLAEVGGEPLLAHQLRWLAAAGLRDVVINLHHLGQQIVEAFGDGTAHGVRIRYSEEPTLLETGGGIVNALPLLGDEPFVLLNGDIFTDFPLTRLLTRLAPGAGAHLLVTPRPPFREHGDFDLGAAASGEPVPVRAGTATCTAASRSWIPPRCTAGGPSRSLCVRSTSSCWAGRRSPLRCGRATGPTSARRPSSNR